jgi:hypothetical protein
VTDNSRAPTFLVLSWKRKKDFALLIAVELVESRAWPIVPQLVDQVAISELHGVAFEFLGSQEWPIVKGGHLPFLRAPRGTILWLAWGGHEYRIVVGETVWSQYC